MRIIQLVNYDQVMPLNPYKVEKRTEDSSFFVKYTVQVHNIGFVKI